MQLRKSHRRNFNYNVQQLLNMIVYTKPVALYQTYKGVLLFTCVLLIPYQLDSFVEAKAME